jgi:hypothetical protein
MITEDFLGRIFFDSIENLISFHLGISLKIQVDDDDNERLWLNPSNNFKRKSDVTVMELSTDDKNIVRTWEENSGGSISFYAPMSFINKTTIYEIKLYTVLSAYEPHQPSIPAIEDGIEEMNWKRLEAVIQSRYPDRACIGIQNAVKQYVHFLELNKDKNDYQSRFYAPSIPIIKVWIAHLSFLDRYQSDVQVFTGVKSKIFDHNPITKDKLLDRYKITRQAHTQANINFTW